MSSTIRNMWKVICDRKCGAVIMLSDLIENGMVCLYNVYITQQATFTQQAIIQQLIVKRFFQ